MILDVARYALLTALIAAGGIGVLTCLRVPFDRSTRNLMGPVFGQSLWAILIGGGVSLGFPVERFAVSVCGVTAVLACIGIWQLRGVPSDRSTSSATSLVPAVVAISPVLVLSPYFRHGLAEYPGSGLPDGWSYVAYGQYLWQFSRGAEGGLAPLYQFASTLSSTRNVASGQLGVLALLRNAGEVQAGFGLLQAGALVTFAATTAAFARQSGMNAKTAAITVTATVVSGWMLNVVWANNLDNQLALAYAPALAVMASWPRRDSPGWWMGIAWLAAGLLHTYPELGIPLILCAMLSAAVSMASGSIPTQAWRLPALAAGVVTIVLMPPLGELVQLMRSQLQATTAIGQLRPGDGLFSGLLVPRHILAGWWGLGSEHSYDGWFLPRTLAASGLWALLAIGLLSMIRQRRLAPLVWLVLPLGLAPFLAASHHYSYGAYKAIIMGWWSMVFLAVHGASTLTRAWPRTRAIILLGWMVIVTLPAAAGVRLLVAPVSRSFRMPRPQAMAVFRQVRDVGSIVGSDPVLVAVRDEEAAEWAVYYLRGLPTHVFTQDRYMAPKAAVLARSQPIDLNRVRWVVADWGAAASAGFGPGWTVRWRGGAYSLWETPPGAGVLLKATFSIVR